MCSGAAALSSTDIFLPPGCPLSLAICLSAHRKEGLNLTQLGAGMENTKALHVYTPMSLYSGNQLTR